jgi:benzoyl-CoA reductase subunit C
MPTATENLVERCREVVADLSLGEVRRWKEEHPQSAAIGFFPVYTPAELIHAAGMLPVGLNGAGDRLDLQHADARFGSFICSIVKTTLEMGLTGYLDLLDGILFSGICDSARNLAFVFERNFPKKYIEFLHLPQNPSSSASAGFLKGEYQRLADQIEKLGGRKIEDAALQASIALYNENRSLLRALYAHRAAHPHQIRTTDLYLVLRAGNFVPVETHNAWLAEAVSQLPVPQAKPRDSVRIVIEGSFCEQPPLDLIRLIEDAGCYILDDDFILGRRWFTEDVPVDGDPLGALAESYLNRSVYSSVRHDFRHRRHNLLVEKTRRLGANAVLFLIAKFCEPAYFDYVLFKRELEAASIPHLLLEFEEKAFTFDRLRTEVETFVESLLFN